MPFTDLADDPEDLPFRCMLAVAQRVTTSTRSATSREPRHAGPLA